MEWWTERDGDGHAKQLVPCHSHPPLGPAHVLHTALLLGSLAPGLAGVKRVRCLMAGHRPQLIPVLLEPTEVLGPGSLSLLLWEVASFLMSRSGGSGCCYLFQKWYLFKNKILLSSFKNNLFPPPLLITKENNASLSYIAGKLWKDTRKK